MLFIKTAGNRWKNSARPPAIVRRVFSTLLITIICLTVVTIEGKKVIADEFPLRTDKPPIGRAKDKDFINESSLTGYMSQAKVATLLDFDDFDTGIAKVTLEELAPDDSIGMHSLANSEEIFLFLNGPVEFTLGEDSAELSTGSLIVCPQNVLHSVKNISGNTLRWLKITVLESKSVPHYIEQSNALTNITPKEFSENLSIKLDRELMRKSSGSHDGHGPILFRRLFNTEAFATDVHVMSHAIVPPGSSIGYHQHNTREEVYFAVAGSGRLTANGHEIDFRTGDAVPCRLHGAHGVYNDSGSDLELFVFSFAVEKGNVRFEINLDDNLVKQ